MTKKKLMTQSEYARHRGISRQHVSRLVKLGAIRPGPDGKIDPVSADKALDRDSPAEAGGKESFYEAQARKESALAGLRELELKAKQGEYIHRDTAERLWGDVLVACRSRLLAMPSKIAPLVIHCKTLPEVRDKIESAVHEALNELSRIESADYVEGTTKEILE